MYCECVFCILSTTLPTTHRSIQNTRDAHQARNVHLVCALYKSRTSLRLAVYYICVDNFAEHVWWSDTHHSPMCGAWERHADCIEVPSRNKWTVFGARSSRGWITIICHLGRALLYGLDTATGETIVGPFGSYSSRRVLFVYRECCVWCDDCVRRVNRSSGTLISVSRFRRQNRTIPAWRDTSAIYAVILFKFYSFLCSR